MDFIEQFCRDTSLYELGERIPTTLGRRAMCALLMQPRSTVPSWKALKSDPKAGETCCQAAF
jgi:hypothetical protein